MKWYPRNVGDYLGRTLALTFEEDGAFTRLLDAYYATEEPLPANAMQLHRTCRCTTPAERDLVDRVVRMFFEPSEDGWRNAKADAEIKKSNEISDKRRLAAESRHGKDHASADASACASAEHLHTQSQSQSQKELKPSVRPARDVGFDLFWATWPKSKRKVGKDACQRKWNDHWSKPGFVGKDVLAHVAAMKQTKQWLDGFEPAPLTYLNQGRWKDGLPDIESTSANPFPGAL